ncbi:MAG: radical SAM protein [Candidatus Margulisiibacteriota bacterium]
MKDSFGRNINYLRIAVTDLCNLRCRYCMPKEGVELKKHDDILSYEEIIEVAKCAVKLGIKKVRLTGGEPLVRANILYLVEQIAKIPGINDFAMTTNGTLLKQYAADLKKAGLHRVNVSLDSLRDDRYYQITRGGNLKDVQDGLEEAIRVGLQPIKINMVVIPDFNEDEVNQMIKFARILGVKTQFIKKMDLHLPKTHDHHIFDRPPKCNDCNRLRLTADGKLKPCLFSDIEISVRELGAEEAIKKAVSLKPQAGTVCNEREMVEIGG